MRRTILITIGTHKKSGPQESELFNLVQRYHHCMISVCKSPQAHKLHPRGLFFHQRRD
jgi:ABC-type uncharacterized transport system fused permease/ATPase subunit